MTVLLDDENTPDAPTEAEPAVVEKGDPVLDKIMARIGKPEVVSTKLKVMIYGPPGVGKTTFAASSGKTLFIDIESGTRTLIGRDDVDVLEFVSVEQIEAVIRYMKEGNPAFKDYDTIVFDSLTSLQQRMIDLSLDKKSKAAGVPQYRADWEIYGEITQRLKGLMIKFRDIDKNLVMTSHSKEVTDDATKLAMVQPDLTPRLSSAVAGLFDIVGYYRMDSKGNRILQVQPSKLVLAKSRVPLPKELVNPSWENINQ